MQIILIQAEIEAAIRAHILSQFNTSGNVPMVIEFAATRSSDGFKATIDIAHEDLFPTRLQPVKPVVIPPPASPATGSAPPAPPVASTPSTPVASAAAVEAVAAEPVTEAAPVNQEFTVEMPAIVTQAVEVVEQRAEAEVAAEVEEVEVQGTRVPEPEPTVAEPVAAAEVPTPGPGKSSIFSRPKLVKQDPPFDGGVDLASAEPAGSDAPPAGATAGGKRSLFTGLKRPTS